MRVYLLIMLASLFIPRVTSGAELTITVRYPDGTAAQGIKVQQLQLTRSGKTSLLLGTTDEQGRITAKFHTQKSTYENPHGYGVYRYVIMPKNYRWEVSDLFYWNKRPYNNEVLRTTRVWEYDYYEKCMRERKNNWSIGELVKVLPDSQLRWEITLTKGRNVEIEVVDQFKEPVKNERISVSLDLEALSHTGYGAEIAMFDVRTDNEGCFNFPNAGPYFYSFDLCDHRYCAPDMAFWTGIIKSKLEPAKETLIYHKCIEKGITFVVTDKQTGNSIPNARILQVKLFQSSRQGGPFGYTDINGEYISRKFYTEHVVQFGVYKEGYECWIRDIEQFVPGKTYMIFLKPKVD